MNILFAFILTFFILTLLDKLNQQLWVLWLAINDEKELTRKLTKEIKKLYIFSLLKDDHSTTHQDTACVL